MSAGRSCATAGKEFRSVGDRGRITDARIREDFSQAEGLDWITSLRAPAIAALVESEQGTRARITDHTYRRYADEGITQRREHERAVEFLASPKTRELEPAAPSGVTLVSNDDRAVGPAHAT
jgi:hypothetical protein